MLRLALRGLGSRKLRTFTTTLAVFLGVAFVAGTYVLTDTINRSFDDIFSEAVKGTDIAVTPREPVKQDDRDAPAFPARVLEGVRGVEGVERAEGGIFSMVKLVDAKGEPLVAGFAPNFVSSALPEPFETFTYTGGRPPRTAREAAVDASSAKRAGLRLGGQVGVAGGRKAKRYRITGLVRLGETASGGASTAVLTRREAQRVTAKEGKFDQISIAAAGGVEPQELKRRIAEVMPRAVRVETGEENAERESRSIAEDLGFLKVALLVFAFVSIFVGAFLIFNTFSITVAQRIREFGMLRTLGASRRQILASVGTEALLIGVVGSVLGLLGGVAFAPLINSLFKSTGIDLPNTGTVLAVRTVIVSLAIGIGVTLVSALSPALRATRVSPLAALREAALPESAGRGPKALAAAVVLAVAGVVAVLVGLFGGIESSGSAAGVMGAGTVGVLLAVSVFSPRLVRPLASVSGRPLEAVRGITGRLARENAVRKPGRTAVTAAALMIGLAVVTFVTVFASGLSKSIDDSIDRNFQGDLTVQSTDGFSPIPDRIERRVKRLEGVQTVSSLAYSAGRVKGVEGEQRLAAVDPRTVRKVLKLDFDQGEEATLTGLGRREAIIDKGWGESKRVDVGDKIVVGTPTGKRAAYRVKGSVKDSNGLLGSFVITQRALARDFGERFPRKIFVSLEPDAKGAGRGVEQVVKREFPAAESLDQRELKDSQADQINGLLGLIYALLSLAVIVSLFGIVNTLALSIHERTRELGMMRAIGMSRRQVRQVVRYEAVITALIGAILGSLLGVVFAALVSRPLADEGFVLSFPVVTLVVLLVLAALAGVVAAIGPARRASRIDVLEALAYE
ncbi:MAG: ABC transporter permease [Actinomycetota bacterium]|nr:ABC transporter permease [Actinomycetota bacterium]MDQ3647286.1 ABC transporter permease [Actinomycetota bacterium]